MYAISIVNEKGGVGKTTTTVSIGSILASRGYKIVMIDLDPQSDLTISCPVELQPEIDIFTSLFKHNKLKGLNVNPNLVIVPGNPYLTPINFQDQLKLSEELRFENPRVVLRNLLQPLYKREDVIVLMDCPPNKDLIVQNALVASTHVLIPTFCHNFSYNGIMDILKLTQMIKSKLNQELEVLGVLINNYDHRNNIDKGVFEMIKEQLATLVFNTPVRTNTKLKEVTHLGVEIIEYARQMAEKRIPVPFQGFADYNNVVDEFLHRLSLPNHLENLISHD